MNGDSDLTVEHYRFITSLQTYQADVARGALDRHLKWFGTLSAGGIALLSTKSTLDLQPDLIVFLGRGIFVILLISGVASAIQILDTLRSWRGLREEQRELFPKAAGVSPFWWLRESTYILLITATVILFYCGSRAAVP